MCYIFRMILLIWSITPSQFRRSFTPTCVIASSNSDSSSVGFTQCHMSRDNAPEKYLNLALLSWTIQWKILLWYPWKSVMLSSKMTILFTYFSDRLTVSLSSRYSLFSFIYISWFSGHLFTTVVGIFLCVIK